MKMVDIKIFTDPDWYNDDDYKGTIDKERDTIVLPVYRYTDENGNKIIDKDMMKDELIELIVKLER